MARVNYTKTVKLVNKGSGNPITYPSSGAVSNGDLTNWIVSMDLSNKNELGGNDSLLVYIFYLGVAMI